MTTTISSTTETFEKYRQMGAEMKVNKIDHICIAVKNLDQARKVWEPVLGKSRPDDEYIDEPEKIKVARYWVGEVGFELMESTTPVKPWVSWNKKIIPLSGVPVRSGIVNSPLYTPKR